MPASSASSASRTASRISCNSRCRRCFRCCAREFDVSWTLLGFVVGVFYVASGLVQFAAGFVVDRLGARPVLLAVSACSPCGTLLASLAPNPWWLFPCAAIMGAGNGVFHPSDFAILNANVTPRRLGHAYSTHGVGGNLGYALAPIVSFGLGAAFGWRVALAGDGRRRARRARRPRAASARILTSQRAPDAHLHTLTGSVALFVQPAILLCFFYFVFQTTASIGLQTFLPSALNAGLRRAARHRDVGGHRVPARRHGGHRRRRLSRGAHDAARSRRGDRPAGRRDAARARRGRTRCRCRCIVPLFVVIGLFIGATGPSRDLIVRNATPKGAAGRVYGFVYSGLDLGAMLGPVWFGLMLDHGLAREVFFVIAALFVVAIATVVQVRARRRAAHPA